jgi:hypothetical protein
VATSEPLAEAAAAATEPVAETLTTVSTPLTEAVAAVSEPLVETVATAAAPVAEVATGVTAPVAEAVTTLSEPLAEAAAAATEPVAETLTTVSTPLTKAVAAVSEPLVETVATAAAPVAGVVTSVGGPLANAVAAGSGPVTESVVAAAEPLAIALDAGATSLVTSAGAAAGALGTAGSAVADGVAAVAGIVDGAPAASAGVASATEATVDAVGFSGLSESLAELIDAEALLEAAASQPNLVLTAGLLVLASMTISSAGRGPAISTCAANARLAFTNVRVLPCLAAQSLEDYVSKATAAAAWVGAHAGPAPSGVSAEGHRSANRRDRSEAGVLFELRGAFSNRTAALRRAAGDEDGADDARLIAQIGIVLATVYASFLTAWFWATRLRWNPRS